MGENATRRRAAVAPKTMDAQKLPGGEGAQEEGEGRGSTEAEKNSRVKVVKPSFTLERVTDGAAVSAEWLIQQEKARATEGAAGERETK
ncbi:hypothetical protein NDU88_003175 [Pleurodeles waltl]|uniref:Uncharacterized protein n=1 Tax=Pleurodeles waltl TaxID=8319 RepID=A0AAV7RC58_PLEWA|nr:hypothetical protein NDU88_003175 [Pleurodeles waltl]